MARYTDELDFFGELLTVKEFVSSCSCGVFTDYDGYGHPVKDKKVCRDIVVIPSMLGNIPVDATHIIWYNS